MKNKTLTLIIALFSIIMTLACNNEELPKGTPRCIKKQIKEVLQEPIADPPVKVLIVFYGDEIYYYFTAACCDAYSTLYDERCNTICHPDGGITGAGDGQCPSYVNDDSFWEHTELVWEDDRERE